MVLRITLLLGLMAIAVYTHEVLAGDLCVECLIDYKQCLNTDDDTCRIKLNSCSRTSNCKFFKKDINLTDKISAAAIKYKLDRTYLSCLFKIESSYNYKAISSTHDHGIGQINEKTAVMLKMDVQKLTNNLDYSIDRAASMLAYYKWLVSKDEPRTWVCRYNVGPGSLKNKNRSAACEAYLDRFYGCTTSNLVGVL